MFYKRLERIDIPELNHDEDEEDIQFFRSDSYSERRSTVSAKDIAQEDPLSIMAVESDQTSNDNTELLVTTESDVKPMEIESPPQPKQKIRQPLFMEYPSRPTLGIQVPYALEREYDRVKKGKGDDTKVLKNTCARFVKLCSQKSQALNLTGHEVDQVNHFNNSIDGLRELFGFMDIGEEIRQDTGNCDRIRKLALEFTGHEFPAILSNNANLRGKLNEIRFWNRLQNGVFHPDILDKWK